MKLVLALSLALISSPSFAAKKSDVYKIDPGASIAKWEGKKLAGSHQGELKFKGGTLHADKGALTSGEVMIDMTTLKNYDQTGDFNTKLVNHLKSDDFFSVEKFPVSTLKINQVVTKDGQTTISGDLTIKGITKPISFPATVMVDAKKVTAKGDMVVDRTMYDIKFRSLKFFSDIGDKVINDTFTVSFDVTANK